MKSAYELAMERLAKSDPDSGAKLTPEKKARLAEIDPVVLETPTYAGFISIARSHALDVHPVPTDVDGRVVYSDEPRLIGTRYALDDAKREVLRTGTTRAELSDLSGPENQFERGQGDLYEVYLPVRAPDGTQLLFETYQRRSAVAATKSLQKRSRSALSPLWNQ